LFESEQVELTFTDGALKEIASVAFHINEEMENIGARRLSTVMSKLLNEFLYDVPEVIGPNAKISVTKEMVSEKLDGLVKDKDLSQYIL
jgi:ATP-dependent HslUV protease ATP-binding subunit HslU